MRSQLELDAVVSAARNGATVLTGNTRAARFVMSACDRVSSATARAWQTPDVLPLSTWVQRVFREAQVAAATELVLLNQRQSHSVWRQSIGEASYPEMLRPTSTSGHAAQAWTLVHAYRIPLNGAFEATAESKAFLGWARRYQQALARKNWTDGARVADELAKALPKIGPLLPKEIYLWECGELTPQHAELIAAIERSNVKVTAVRIESERVLKARRLACDDSAQELSRAAAYCRAVLCRNPAARIGVVVPKLRELRAQVESTFLETLHPEFYAGVESARLFDISLGESLASYSLVGAALRSLKFAVGEMNHHELRELLMSQWLGGADTESDERARVCRWLGENGKAKTSASGLLRLMNPAEYEGRARKQLERISAPKLRRILSAIARPEGMPSKAAMSDWATMLGQWLGKLGWPGPDDRQLDSRSFQAYTKWLELLSDLASLDVTQGAVTFREAVEEITRAAAAQAFAPENTGAPVQIMDVDEAEGSLFDYLWVCGLDDETWPQRKTRNAFIPTAVLRAAKVPRSSPESQAEISREALARLNASAARVVLSYPRMDGDRELRMSPGIVMASEVAWEDLGVAQEESWMKRMRGAGLETFTDSKAPAAKSDELVHRGTSLVEKQSACPFRAFAELRLGGTKVEEPSQGIDDRDRGTLIERVLELFWEQARELENLRQLGAEERRGLLEAAVNRAIGEKLQLMQSPAEMRMREIERERLTELAAEWIELELSKRSAFDQVRHQQPFTYVVNGVELHGRIDRIDRSMTQLGEVIIDYKASKGSQYVAKSWETPRPRLPQLPLYATFVQSQGRAVVGVGFGTLSTSHCELKGLAVGDDIFGRASRASWAKPTLPEQIDEWTREIEKLVGEHVSGVADVDPKVPPSRSNSTCGNCHLNAMCRVAEMTVSDTDEEESDEQ